MRQHLARRPSLIPILKNGAPSIHNRPRRREERCVIYEARDVEDGIDTRQSELGHAPMLTKAAVTNCAVSKSAWSTGWPAKQLRLLLTPAPRNTSPTPADAIPQTDARRCSSPASCPTPQTTTPLRQPSPDISTTAPTRPSPSAPANTLAPKLASDPSPATAPPSLLPRRPRPARTPSSAPHELTSSSPSQTTRR